MSSLETDSQKSLCRLFSLLGIVLLVSCSEDGQTNAEKEDATIAIVHTLSTAREESINKKHAALELGGKHYELGMVICIGTTTATITANDSQKRADFPIVSVKTYDSAMTGGQSIDSVSAYFERDGYGENWSLHGAVIVRDGDLVSASGTLKVQRLVLKEDDTRTSAPIEGIDELPFTLRIEC